jgi:hypothetical protein
LLPALGANIYGVPVSAYIRRKTAGAGYATNTEVEIYSNGLSACFELDILSTTAVYLSSMTNVGGGFNLNEPVFISAKIGDPTAGTGTFEVVLNYIEIDLP